MKREGFRFWYRNPQQPGQLSLGIAYISGEQYGIVRPDFIFFATQAMEPSWPTSLTRTVSIWPTRCPSCKALPCTTHAKVYRRIESVAEATGKLRVLDLTNGEVRKGIITVKDAATVFNGGLARDY